MKKEIQPIHDKTVEMVEQVNTLSTKIEDVGTGTMSADKVHSLLAAGNELHEAGIMLNRARVRLASIT